MTDESEPRAAVVHTAQAFGPSGLGVNRSGNVSARCTGGMLITPTGVPCPALDPASIVFLDLDGHGRAGELAPSSEWRMHVALYAAFPGCGAVVHCHSPAATALACAGRRIPPFHYMVAAAGRALDRVRALRYSRHARAVGQCARRHGRRPPRLPARQPRPARLGPGPRRRALDLAREVEALADQYARVLQLGAPVLLDEAEMAHVLEKFTTYGQQPES